MINIDIMELYKLYVADPDRTREVLKNILYHELLSIEEAITEAKDTINGLDKQPRNLHNKTNQIPQIREELTKLPAVFGTGVAVMAFFRVTTISGHYTGEDARMRLTAVMSKVESINSKFYERLEQGITDQMPRDEQDGLKEKNIDPAKEIVANLLNLVIDEICEIGVLYSID